MRIVGLVLMLVAAAGHQEPGPLGRVWPEGDAGDAAAVRSPGEVGEQGGGGGAEEGGGGGEVPHRHQAGGVAGGEVAVAGAAVPGQAEAPAGRPAPSQDYPSLQPQSLHSHNVILMRKQVSSQLHQGSINS